MILQIAAPPQDELTFIELMMKGGYVMIPILLLSLAAIYVAIERYLYLRSAISSDNHFISKITRALSSGNIAEAKRYADDDTSAPGKIISARSEERRVGKECRS